MKQSIYIGILFTCLLSYANATQVHKVAIRTHSGIEAGTKKWQPTMDYLSQTIPGHRFEMIPYQLIEQQILDAQQHKFEFVLTNPSTYIALTHTTGARALVTLNNKRHDTSQTRFGSVIFTRADRDDIIQLADLKDKHLIAVSPLGFGGWQVAWREMLRNNFNPDTELGKLSFAEGIQPDVVKAVQQGQADAGVVRTDMLERLNQQGIINLSEFRIVHNRETEGFPFFHSTPLYPEWPFAVMPKVDDTLANQVKQALLKINLQHPAAQSGQYSGWIPALDYQEVDKLLKELHVGSYANTSKRGIGYFYPVTLVALLLVIYYILKKPASKPV